MKVAFVDGLNTWFEAGEFFIRFYKDEEHIWMDRFSHNRKIELVDRQYMRESSFFLFTGSEVIERLEESYIKGGDDKLFKELVRTWIRLIGEKNEN